MTRSAAVVSLDTSGVRLIYLFAGAAGIACGLLLLAGIAVAAARALNVSGVAGGAGRLASNWLVTLFNLHSRVDGITKEMLGGVRLADVLILTMTTVAGVGLFFALKNTTLVWSLIGMALPAAGIVLYALTQLTGRSAVMGAVLVFALIALWSPSLGRVAPFVGILAAALLLVGDFTEPLRSRPVAVLMGIGYVALVVWFALIGMSLLRVK